MNHSFIFKYSYYFSNIQPVGREAGKPGGQEAGRPGGREAGRPGSPEARRLRGREARILKRHPFAFTSQISSLIASSPPRCPPPRLPASQLI